MPSYRNCSVVALGRFNPAIFQPEWFRRYELLPEAELEGIEGEARRVLVSNDITVVTFDSLSLKVQSDRWQLLTEQPDWFEDLGPIARSVFDKLPHTPISAVGLNYSGDFELGLGRSVEALLERWLPIAELAAVVGEDPQLGGTVRGRWRDYIATVVLESSRRLKNSVSINQNYERRDVRSGEELMDVLDADWQQFLERAKLIVDRVLED